MRLNNSLMPLKTAIQLLTSIVLLFTSNISIAQQPSKSNHDKANELNSKAVNIVFKGEHSEESLNIANRMLDSAIILDPGYPILYTNKIQNLCMLKDYEQALLVNGKLLKLQPNTPEIIMGRGLILNKLGKKSQAMSNFKQSSRIFEKQYIESPNLKILENLAFNRYLVYNRDSAYALINREKYRFQSPLRTKNQLDTFTQKIFPMLNKDNAL